MIELTIWINDKYMLEKTEGAIQRHQKPGDARRRLEIIATRIPPENRERTQMFAKGKQILLRIRHPPFSTPSVLYTHFEILSLVAHLVAVFWYESLLSNINARYFVYLTVLIEDLHKLSSGSGSYFSISKMYFHSFRTT